MRIEVPSKNYMNELSKILSKAGIMNRPKEELDWEIKNFISLKNKFKELRNLKIDAVSEALDEFENAYKELVKKLREKGLSFKELNDDPMTIHVLETLEENDCLELSEDKLKLKNEIPLDELVVEIEIPVEDVIEEIEAIERAGGKLVTEVKLLKRYYIEVMEVDIEAIGKALEMAEEYTDEDVILEASIAGIAKSALSEVILSLIKDIRRKDELVEILLSLEPVEIEGEKGSLRIYFEEDAIEDLLKELQTLGYLKVKGNRIWFY
ncbi:hypothetical protein PNA2_0750 [Pyrococcus sp. NA2]|uniref:hypothetical protein n=1 Tax=Pyrococcus sp. (strain NA2) TaxID=342949 RepID=UPI000209AE6F|nr:hypothetical protein [Pyrococcus sp. NA2]AEC51666.1 hypothetical protein PNA2_0750 [Pyrococcus sp. NA2]